MYTTFLKLTLVASSIQHAVASTSASLPRGVSPDHASYYQDSTKFVCIYNPSISLSTTQVNDDYCDCPDGSDEPGTSACSHISPRSPPLIINNDPTQNNTAALPGFYCYNEGHNPHYVPFAYVNDGVCDTELCCDGSDEWAQAGGVKCENKCKEIGAAWQRKDTAKRHARAAASKKRAELVVHAKQLKAEIERKITSLKSQLNDDDLRIKQAEQELADQEKRDKLRIIRAPATGGKLGTLASLARRRIDDLRQALLKSQQDKHAAESRIKELEGILDTFKTEYNPNFNDEGVKRAVRAWEDYDARGRFPVSDHAAEKEVEELGLEDHHHGIIWDDYEGETSDTDACKWNKYQPKSCHLTDRYSVRLFGLSTSITSTMGQPKDYGYACFPRREWHSAHKE